MTVLASRKIEVQDFGQFELNITAIERLNLDVKATIWVYRSLQKYDTNICRGIWEKICREVRKRTPQGKIGSTIWKTAMAKALLDSLATRTNEGQDSAWISFTLWSEKYNVEEEVLWWYRKEEVFGGKE